MPIKPVATNSKTPCVGVCSTGIGDQVCRGCKRYAQEVVQWNSYSEQQKASINYRLHTLAQQVMHRKLALANIEKLRAQIEQSSVHMRHYEDPYLQAFEVIKCLQEVYDTSILRDYGIELRQAYWRLPLRLLFKEIDDELYTLSKAHYERYFQE